ncbi:hydrolase 1, exosortase A system-associated [Paucibacter sp. B51]|uniref:hydrolase 1, exosortase A system-associated n=1 Tax=Paucibacter sp. B51 TaxID=2993315 RepID=UPI0022EBB939|nr:hydrolase 1, exosortase A system-associated [Paucibacter sp. B51]
MSTVTSKSYLQQALTFTCEGQTLQAVLTLPPAEVTAQALGVLIVVGGPQYRAGSHRQFTLLSRELARQGFPVLRFDHRGMGDSSGELHDFKQITADIGAALDAFQAAYPDVQRLVIWGLCDAASAALMYWQRRRDTRLAGLCLLNPWVRSEASLAKATVKHYYLDRLKQPEFWKKLLSGRVAGAALRDLLGNLRRARAAGAAKAATSLSFQEEMATAWRQLNSPLLLILSGRDLTAKEFLEHAQADAGWQGLLQATYVTRADLTEADHTFSNAAARDQVAQLTADWLRQVSSKTPLDARAHP